MGLTRPNMPKIALAAAAFVVTAAALLQLTGGPPAELERRSEPPAELAAQPRAPRPERPPAAGPEEIGPPASRRRPQPESTTEPMAEERGDAAAGTAAAAETAAAQQSWTVTDPDKYPLNVDVVQHYARLPDAYRWPLPIAERLELICFRKDPSVPYLGIMQTADGRLYHWGEERRFLQNDLDLGRIASTEIRTIAGPGAFLQPLRAAAHAVCGQDFEDSRQTGKTARSG